MNTNHNHLFEYERRMGCRGGFTLVEVMMASAIGSIVVGAVLTTYLFSVKGFAAVGHYSEIHADGRRAIDVFARDMRAVNSVVSFTSSSLVVTIPTAFNNGAIASTKTVTYSLSNSAFYRTDSSTGTTAMLASNVYQLSFLLYDRLGSNTTSTATAKGVQVDLKLRKHVISQVQSEDYLSARLDMRNKS